MKSSFLSSLARRLRDIREDSDRSQKDTAEALGTNLRTYRRYEYGETEPQVEFIADFCRHFGISADYLLGLSDVRPEPETLSARFRRSPLDNLTDDEMGIVASVISAIRSNDEKKKNRESGA